MPQKETCAGCQRSIEDRFLLRVMDNSWHETCLQCNICLKPLTRSCFVKDRKLFCKLDYDRSVLHITVNCFENILDVISVAAVTMRNVQKQVPNY